MKCFIFKKKIHKLRSIVRVFTICTSTYCVCHTALSHTHTRTRARIIHSKYHVHCDKLTHLNEAQRMAFDCHGFRYMCARERVCV